jgi:hypothetical protein
MEALERSAVSMNRRRPIRKPKATWLRKYGLNNEHT